MRKTTNGESSLSGTVREKPSPAVSGFQGRVCEVHPGVDPEKSISMLKEVTGYGSHTLRVSSEGQPL